VTERCLINAKPIRTPSITRLYSEAERGKMPIDSIIVVIIAIIIAFGFYGAALFS
jgi:hypothetical protein